LKVDGSQPKRKAFATELLRLFEVLRGRGSKSSVHPTTSSTTVAPTTTSTTSTTTPQTPDKNALPSSSAASTLVCCRCKLALDGPYSCAMDKMWHNFCFTCVLCKKVLTGQYVAYEGEPYCAEDFYRKFQKTCAGCKAKIEGAFVKAADRDWHDGW